MTFYTAPALGKQVGATYRQISYWTERGLLSPVQIEGNPDAGTGNRRIYSDSQLPKARLLALLYRPESVGKVAEALVSDGRFQLDDGSTLTWLGRGPS